MDNAHSRELLKVLRDIRKDLSKSNKLKEEQNYILKEIIKNDN